MEKLTLVANLSIVFLTFVTVLLNWWTTVSRFKAQAVQSRAQADLLSAQNTEQKVMIAEVKHVADKVEVATNGFLQASKDAAMAAGLLQGAASGFREGHADAKAESKIEAAKVLAAAVVAAAEAKKE